MKSPLSEQESPSAERNKEPKTLHSEPNSSPKPQIPKP